MRVSVLCSGLSTPRSWGITLPFIGQGGGDLQACRTILLRVKAW
jgi:hypothetical protein